MYLLGYDIGSSSIKAALVDAQTGRPVAVVQHPDREMTINAPHQGWAEQHPETWWDAVCQATQKLLVKTNINPESIKGIGISYQMHGLVVVDKNQKVLRPSIIWCDSRAVDIGNKAFDGMGKEFCLKHLLNSPGNFTASKLSWVKENEPELYPSIHKIMLPGDYIAMKLTGEIATTNSGLSEGIFWDFQRNDISEELLKFYDINKNLIAPVVPTFSIQGLLTEAAAEKTGLKKGTPVAYRAGDQPNNALSLNVLQPGEVAATGGTSGVVYGIVDKPVYDPPSRVNGFAHVNHSPENPRIGILLCINGSGIQYNWVRQNMAEKDISYTNMEKTAAIIPVGSDGLTILPFGNGAERMLENRNPGASFLNVDFNRHSKAHFYRAALEGIAFAFVHGMGILKNMGLNMSIMRVGNDNLFQSAVFAETISTLLGSNIQVVETTGAVGAAKAAGVATGIYSSIEEAMKDTEVLKTYHPLINDGSYNQAFKQWEDGLKTIMK